MINQTESTEIADWSKLSAAPLVSIQMLAYSHEKFIAQAIDGVISQQCDFPIELIIGEDCSPDRTREIVLDYQKRYPHIIRVITSNQNVGMYANDRRCQLAARGKYVASCEGDDYWHHPRKLKMQVDLMEADPSMVICHTDFDRLTKFRRRRSCHKRYPSQWLAKGESYTALLHEWSVATATSMCRRDVLMSFIGSPYDNPAWPFGDRNKLLFASLHGTFGYINESTATFRKRMGSAMNSGEIAKLAMANATLDCIKLSISEHPPESGDEHIILTKVYRMVYESAFRAGQLERMNEAAIALAENGSSISNSLHKMHQIAIRASLPILVMNRSRALIDRFFSAM